MDEWETVYTPDDEWETIEEPDSVGRQLGLTARAILGGAGKSVTGIGDAVNSALDAGLEAVGSDFRFGRTTPYVDQALDAMGLPEPRGNTERMVNRAGEFVAGGAPFIKAGQAVKGAEALAANPMIQGVSSASAGAAHAATEDMGEGAQLAATLAAGAVPGLTPAGLQSSGRTLIRGRDPSAMRQNIQDFENVGLSPTVGQAAANRRMQATESVLSKTPGGAGRMARAAEDQNAQAGRYIESATKGTPEQAGLAVERGARDFASRFKQKAGKLYDAVDKFIAPETPIELNATKRVFSKPTASSKYAPNTSKELRPQGLERLGVALSDDIKAQLDQSGFAGLPYQAVKEIRTAVGERLGNVSLVDDVPRGQLKRLYGALSEDLTEAAKKRGPNAAGAAQRANKYWKAGLDRIDLVERVVKKAGGPEKIYKSLMSGTQDGATVLRSVMKSLRPDERELVASTLVRKMGKATPGRAVNDESFSLATYLTNWNRLSPEAKSTLFGWDNKGIRQATEHVARVAENVRKGSGVFSNPSGTQPAITLQASTLGAVVAAITGNLGAAAAILSVPLTANLGSRLMTNPNFVRWLAKSTSMPKGASAAAMSQLAQIAANDPDIQELLELLEQQENY